MALPKTDAFTVGYDQRISTYNANWKENNSQWTILDASDDVYVSSGGTGGESLCHWEGDTFNNNQYSQIVISAVVAAYRGPACRVASGTSTETGYGFYGSNNNTYLFKIVTATWTQLGSTTAAVALNDVMKLTANGTTITPNKNGSTTGTPGAQTDSSISSGYGGMCGYSTDNTTRADNYEGGDVGGTPVTAKPGLRPFGTRKGLNRKVNR